MAQKELAWSAPEFEYWHKPRPWYLILMFVSAALVLLALWQANFLFGIFVVIAAIVLIRSGAQVPRHIDFRLTGEALVIDNNKVYAYDGFSGFATRRVDDLEDGLSELLLLYKHRFGTQLRVLYPVAMTEEIRHFLNTHMHEIEHEESIFDHLSRWLRF